MRWWFVVPVVCLAGCDLIFPLREPTNVPADAPTDGFSPSTRCSPATLIVDDFTEDGPVRRPWIVDGSAPIANATQAGGELVVNVMGGTMDVFAEVYLDLRDSRFSVGVRHVQGTPAVGDAALLVLDTQDGNHRLTFGLEAQDEAFDLVARFYDFQTSVDSIEIDRRPYDSSIRNIAIEHVGTITRFLVAGDDLAYSELFANTLIPFDWIGFMRPRLFVFAANETNTYRFDRFNGGGEPSGTACPIDTLVETFQGNVSSAFQTVENNCAIEFDAAGDLRMTFGEATGSASCELHSSTYHDLRGRSLYVRVEDYNPRPATNAAIEFAIETRKARASFLATDDNQLRAVVFIGTSEDPRGASGFGLPAQQFWRFRGTDDDALVWETSADGTTYAGLGSSPAGALGPLDVVRVVLQLVGRGGDNSIAEFGGINDGS